MKENLIISAVHDLEYDKMAPFLESLRQTGSTARVHLFVSNVSARSREKMEALGGVTTQVFNFLHFRRRRPLLLVWPLWKKILASRDLAGKCRLALPVFQFVALRHVLAYEFLLGRQDEFENVLLTDSRDVYFQRDPFSDNLGPGLHCFLEARTQIVETCRSNSKMVRTAFGPEVLAELAKAPVSCAGATLGDLQSVLAYEKTMIELLCTIQEMTQSNDQGVHNYLIQKQLVPGIQVHDNYSSSVFTAGCEPTSAIRLNERDEIIREDGTPYPILHQHDRHPEILKRLLAKLQVR